jgi:hypothetical protein
VEEPKPDNTREPTDPEALPGVVVEPRDPGTWGITSPAARRRLRLAWPLLLLMGGVLVWIVLRGTSVISAGHFVASFFAFVLIVGGLVCFTLDMGRRLPPRGLAWAMGAAAVVTILVVSAAIQDRPFLVALLGLVPAVLPAGGGLIMGLGMPHLKGRTLHCARCGYEYTRGSGWQCPECGKAWTAKGGLVRGVRQPVNWYWIATGLAVMLVSPLSAFWGRSLTGVLPTSILIAKVGVPHGGFTIDEMKALTSRTLSDSERLSLANAMIRKRGLSDYLSPDEQSWLDGEVARGELPRELVDRYYREMAEVWVVAPASGRSGEPMKVAIGVQDHHPLTQSCTPLILVGGYSLDGDAKREGASDSAQPAGDVGLEHRSFGTVAPGRFAHEATLTPTTAGTTTVHLEYWIIVVPRGSGSVPMSWSANGQPVAPAGALFMERREATRAVPVGP